MDWVLFSAAGMSKSLTVSIVVCTMRMHQVTADYFRYSCCKHGVNMFGSYMQDNHAIIKHS